MAASIGERVRNLHVPCDIEKLIVFFSCSSWDISGYCGAQLCSLSKWSALPFKIDSLLTCHVDNPLAGTEGQPDTIPEDPPRLSFEQIVRQGDHPNVIWLPGESG